MIKVKILGSINLLIVNNYVTITLHNKLIYKNI